MRASSGLARSSISPLGRILFVTRATKLLRSRGRLSTNCHSTGAVSRSARIEARADSACSQRRARWSKDAGSRAAPSTRNRPIASAGSLNSLNDQLTPRFRNSTHSPSAFSSRCNCEKSSSGASATTRDWPIWVCAPRFSNSLSCGYSRVVNACSFISRNILTFVIDHRRDI